MALLKIKIKSEAASLFQLSVDEHVVLKRTTPFEDTFEMPIAEHQKHIISWFVKGNEGESYSLQVMSPFVLEEESGILEEEGMDIGILRINL